MVTSLLSVDHGPEQPDSQPADTTTQYRFSRAALVKWSTLALAVGFVAYLSVGPLYFLMRETIFPDSSLDFSGFDRIFLHSSAFGMLRNSFVFAGGTAALALLIGTSLAYLQVRTDIPFKGLFFAASVVPLIIPGILHTIAWIFLSSPEIGLLQTPLKLLGPFGDVFSMSGMIWVHGLHISPIVFLLMVAAFRSMDPSLEEAALMSGASAFGMLRKITAPLLRPALLGAGLVILVQALESFEVPLLLGVPDNTHVMTTRIYQILRDYPPDIQGAGALALGLLAFASIGIFLSSRLGSGERSYQTISGKGFRSTPMSLGRYRKVLGAGVIAYFGVAVVMPISVLVYVSLLPFYRRPDWGVVSDFTLENYRKVFDSSTFTLVWRNSLLLGLSAGVAVMILSTIAAWIVVRSRLRGRTLLDHLAFLPLVFPGIVLGLAISFVYLRVPVAIYGTLFILLIAYCTRYLPYGMRYAVTSMQQVSNELEESAEVCGATWFYSLRRIIVPLVAPGIISGFVYVVVVSFRELSSSILLYTPRTKVISIEVFEKFESGRFTEAAALGVLMMLALVSLVGVTYWIGARLNRS